MEPESFEVGCRVQATQDIFEDCVVVVKAGTLGSVAQPSLETRRGGTCIDVKWDQHNHGVSHPINTILSRVRKIRETKSVKRHDFGVALLTRCRKCRKLTRNRGCIDQKAIFCTACFEKHLPGCRSCTQGSTGKESSIGGA
mmetsp:Transcript_7712/g.12540  ORF Transcript_7712/g.12540 Transcript_7712/m.12540 type:complete len:141 (-) Transcript_7712:237-659(-)